MLELVTAVIKPHKVDDVKEALLAAGVQGMTLTEVRGFGRQRGKTESFRGAEYKIDFIPKVKLEVIVDAEIAERVVSIISETANTGKIGDGKIWRIPIGELMRVRTGETGISAL